MPAWNHYFTAHTIDDALDVLSRMADDRFDVIVTSPPYYRQRDYGDGRQLGMESTPSEYVERLVAIFAQARRALAAGAHEYVIKPFTADAIVDKLEILGITATQV